MFQDIVQRTPPHKSKSHSYNLCIRFVKDKSRSFQRTFRKS